MKTEREIKLAAKMFVATCERLAAKGEPDNDVKATARETMIETLAWVCDANAHANMVGKTLDKMLEIGRTAERRAAERN